MACPTCSHTMHNLGLDTAGRRSFWCPRCGTLKTEDTDAHAFTCVSPTLWANCVVDGKLDILMEAGAVIRQRQAQT